MKGKLYGVGVGPGDPKDITLKALEIINSSDIVAVPNSGNCNTALDIIKSHLKDQKVIFCPTPMTKDKDILQESQNTILKIIREELSKGKKIAFIVLGDPTIYSTYAYIHNIIRDEGYNTEIISGITSFCAASARLNESLCLGSEPLIIIPANYEEYEHLLDLNGTKVLMKNGSKIMNTKKILEKKGLLSRTKVVERCGMSGEKVFKSVDILSDISSYFSLVIVK